MEPWREAWRKIVPHLPALQRIATMRFGSAAMRFIGSCVADRTLAGRGEVTDEHFPD